MMISDDLDDRGVADYLVSFCEAAARIALDCRAGGLQVGHKGSDLGQALTEADEAISHLLAERFGPRLIEEETAEQLGVVRATALLAEDRWTIVGDPIDGTKPYAGGLPGWGTIVAACRKGKPRIGAVILPAWVDQRDRLDEPVPPRDQRGLLLVAYGGLVFWAPTLSGQRCRPLQPLPSMIRSSFHVGWLPVAAQNFTLDYTKGLFPWCESGFVSDVASLATGRLDATTFNHKLWDLAGTLPMLEALGFTLFRWPDLDSAPPLIADLFDEGFTSGGKLWLVCRNQTDAVRLAEAIRRC